MRVIVEVETISNCNISIDHGNVTYLSLELVHMWFILRVFYHGHWWLVYSHIWMILVQIDLWVYFCFLIICLKVSTSRWLLSLGISTHLSKAFLNKVQVGFVLEDNFKEVLNRNWNCFLFRSAKSATYFRV